jgi:hypothetical protein
MPAHPLSHAAAIVIGAFLVLVTVASAEAQQGCRWFGTAPVCDGRCPAGWSLKEFSGRGCVGTWFASGTKVLCCPPPCKWGTPGCPFPSFGKKPRFEPLTTPCERACTRLATFAERGRCISRCKVTDPCPKGMFKGGDGQCYPRLN